MGMPTSSAASMIMAPLFALIGMPSISMLTIALFDPVCCGAHCWPARSVTAADQALAMIDVILELVAKMLDETRHRHGGGIAARAASAAHAAARYVGAHVEIALPALAVLDAVNHARQPARAFAARRALAAGFLEVEMSDTCQHIHHAGVYVHDDHRTRAQHRAGLGNGVIVHVDLHHRLAGHYRYCRTAGKHRLQILAAAHAARHIEQGRERRAERYFVIAGRVDVARHREYFRSAVGGRAHFQKPFAAVAHDGRHRRERLRVDDGGGAAVQAVARRKRRLEARLAFLAFQRFQQCGLFAADIGAGTEMSGKYEIETRAQNIFAEKTGVARLLQGILETLERLPEFTANVVVAHGGADGVTGDGHAFDQRVRVVTQDVAIFECAGLAFVGIADDIFLTRRIARHEAPLKAGGKARAAAAAQRRDFQLADDFFRRGFFREYLAPGLIAADLEIILKGVGLIELEGLKTDFIGHGASLQAAEF